MKKQKILILLSTLMLLTPVLTSAPAYAETVNSVVSETASENIDENEVVNIPDANLKKTILEKLNKPSDYSITIRDLKSIRRLDGSYHKISNLTGLEYCTNLNALYLRCNQIRDISPLATLTKLDTLDLNENFISDITPLGQLKSLKNLLIDKNSITDVTPLNGAENLDSLTINKNNIGNSIVNLNLSKLIYLSCYKCNISDLSFISNSTELLEFQASSNNIEDISSLASLQNLNQLYLSSNKISDITPLSNLTNLYRINFDCNEVEDISCISNLTNLWSANFYDNEIKAIPDLSNLRGLNDVDLSKNKITDLTPLKAFTDSYRTGNFDIGKKENGGLFVELPDSNEAQKTKFYINDQKICLPQYNYSQNNPLPVTIKDIDGNPVTDISDISNNGVYSNASNSLSWNINEDTEVSYKFKYSFSDIINYSGSVSATLIKQPETNTNPVVNNDTAVSAILGALGKTSHSHKKT